MLNQLLLTTIAAVLLVGTGLAGPIHTAAKKGDLARVQKELDKGVDVNATDGWGMTPFHHAKTKEIAELLITNGADVNAKGMMKELLCTLRLGKATRKSRNYFLSMVRM
jgi:hypothetical protein